MVNVVQPKFVYLKKLQGFSCNRKDDCTIPLHLCEIPYSTENAVGNPCGSTGSSCNFRRGFFIYFRIIQFSGPHDNIFQLIFLIMLESAQNSKSGPQRG